jgi:hypothetical protein
MALKASQSMGCLDFAKSFHCAWPKRLLFLPSASFHVLSVQQLLLLLAAARCIAFMQGAVICVRQVAVTGQGRSAMTESALTAYRSSRADWFTCACAVWHTCVMLLRVPCNWLVVSVHVVVRRPV